MMMMMLRIAKEVQFNLIIYRAGLAEKRNIAEKVTIVKQCFFFFSNFYSFAIHFFCFFVVFFHSQSSYAEQFRFYEIVLMIYWKFLAWAQKTKQKTKLEIYFGYWIRCTGKWQCDLMYHRYNLCVMLRLKRLPLCN